MFGRNLTLGAVWGGLCPASRQICRTPTISATGEPVLDAGFGDSIAIFSFVRNVLLAPLPYVEPSRLIQVVSWWPKTGVQTHWSAPLRDAVEWKSSVPTLQDLAFYRYNLANLTGRSQAEASYGLRVSANLMP